ncbi:hypothetical protein [uncultured Desulfuromusa sp.]|uniref:hypothetical protein n=1 Tax=uncultured Desulfuromusa sp. TaxID=219183 RepID=UPI002AA840F6|nr:hypothetical protein [uncultured Desulfuromusa sp.]
MFWFVFLLLLLGAGFYFYQKMMSIEREIRAEQEAEGGSAAQVQEPEKSSVDLPEMKPFDKDNNSATTTPEQTAAEKVIISAVTKSPGTKQTDLYVLFPDTGRKQLQQTIKNMADNGVLRREKQGSSYLLYLA